MKKATLQQTRHHNTRLVLRTIAEQETVSRADIARATHLTRPTVSTLVAELAAEGLVVEAGLAPSGGGKPPTLLALAAGARHVLTVDIAGQTFRGARLDLRGRIVRRAEAPAAEVRGEAAVRLTEALIDELLAADHTPLLGIGVGAPGLLEPRAGVIRQALNLDWHDLQLRQRLAGRYDQPIFLANDSHAAALGEFVFGDRRPSPHLVLIKTGQGISAGIVLQGALFYGDGAGAGEIGQVVVGHTPAGRPETLEMRAGTRALLRQARAAAGENLTWEAFVAGAAAGRPDLVDIPAAAARLLGAAIAQLIAVLNVQHIVIAGRMTQFGEPFRQQLVQTARAHALAAQVEDTTICLSTLGPDIVLLGCAALILKQELGIL